MLMRTACNLASFQFAFSAINEQPSMNRSRVVAGGGRQRPNHGEVITNLCIGWSQDRVQTSSFMNPMGWSQDRVQTSSSTPGHAEGIVTC